MRDLATGRVWLIGAGPGDPELLTLRAHRLLGEADVVVHDRLVADEILALVPPATRRIDVGKRAGDHPVPQPGINQILIGLAREGLKVARLKGGDPLIFGRGGEEAEALATAGIPVSIVPGITSAQGAAASLGLPLTRRGLATGLRFVTGHRAGDGPLDLDWAGLADPGTTLVIYMGAATIADTARELTAHGLADTTPALAIASATTPRERHLSSTLGAIAADLATARLEGPVLLIIGEVVDQQHPGFLARVMEIARG